MNKNLNLSVSLLNVHRRKISHQQSHSVITESINVTLTKYQTSIPLKKKKTHTVTTNTKRSRERSHKISQVDVTEFATVTLTSQRDFSLNDSINGGRLDGLGEELADGAKT